jgi:very-short-patch-repair endonuclease
MAMGTHECIICGTPFTPRPNNVSIAKYCSIACRTKANSNVVRKICEICGSEYGTSHSDAPKRHTCGGECAKEWKSRKAQQVIEQQYGAPIGDILRSLYAQGNGIKAIARIVGASDHAVWDWFDGLGIERRSRTDAVTLQWKDNTERRASASSQMKDVINGRTLDERRKRSLHANTALQKQRGPTSIERAMMRALDAARIPYDFQFPVGGKFLCDFAIPGTKIIVECDGTYWHSKPRQQKQDASKNAYLRTCGYTVLRFSDTEMKQDIHQCISTIISAIGEKPSSGT